MRGRFEGVDINNAEDYKLLESLQGNILSGHGRAFSAYMIINFHRVIKQGHPFRSWIRDLAIDSALDLEKNSSDNYPSKKIDYPFYNILFTSLGYERLGKASKETPGDVAFRQGALARARGIGDSNYRNWEDWSKGAVGMVLLIANNDEDLLESSITGISDVLGQFLEDLSLTGVLRGTANKHQGLPRDGFGFADGISMPLFMKRHIQMYWSTEPSAAWDPSFNPTDLVLAPEYVNPGGFGSYFVLRKLSQNLAAFDEACSTLANTLGVDKELAEAYIVGRFKDGTPVVSSNKPNGAASNGFNYENDHQGSRCPLHAHTRLMNPRTTDPNELGRQIVRRGFAYDEGGDAGIIFGCFQMDISRQFEFMQRLWGNGSIPDQLIGIPKKAVKWPLCWGNDSKSSVSIAFRKTVTVKGTLYLFAPSLTFLKGL